MNPNDKLKQFIESEIAQQKTATTTNAESDDVAELVPGFVRTYHDGFIEQLQKVFSRAEDRIETLSQSVSKGYITLVDAPPIASKTVKKSKNKGAHLVDALPVVEQTEAPKQQQLFDEFHPMLFDQLLDKPHREFDSFLICVDTFYSEAEEHRLTNKIAVQQRQAADKLLAVRRDHEARLRGLRSVQEVGVRRAELIALNRELVDDVIEFLNNLIAVGMSWTQIDEFIQVEQAEGDPVACRILRLDLEHNSAIIVLNDPFSSADGDNMDNDEHDYDTTESAESDASSGEDEQTDRRNRKKHDSSKKPAADAGSDDGWVDATIDLQLNAFQNMQKLHNEKRTALKKEEKTLQSSEMALRNAERKAAEAMKTVSKIQNIHKTRKTFWFEKFQWFLSSDGILVIAGRDRQQNELIVKRHLGDRDLYVHAELHGASSVVIKSVLKSAIDATSNADDAAASLPPRTLREAGIFAACLSHAWNENISTRAWWVFSHQVSKTAPTGEFLPTGSFMIRGRKNFLPVEPMVMAFGFLFKLDDVSAERRLKLQQQQKNAENDDISAAVDVDARAATGKNDQQLHAADVANDDDASGAAEFPDIQLGTTNNSVDGNNSDLFDIVDKTYTGTAPTTGNKVKPHAPPSATLNKQQQRAQKKHGPASKSAPKSSAAAEMPADAEINNHVDISMQPQAKRGAKNKKRMQRKKYADQDDEERLLRTKLYKSKEQAQEMLSTTASGYNNNNQLVAVDDGLNMARASGDEVGITHGADETGGAGDATKATPGGDDADDNEENDDVNPDAAVPIGDGLPSSSAVVVDDFDDNLVELNEENFVAGVCADPTPDDSLLWCIPVCAPYTSLTNAKYKYKVKLIPAAAQANSANMKRSKIVKSAVAVMTQQKDVTELEKELIKAVKEQELYKSIIGNAKIGLAAQVLKKATTKGGKKKGVKTAAADA